MNGIQAILNWVVNVGCLSNTKITAYQCAIRYLIFAFVCCVFLLKFEISDFKLASYSINTMRQDILLDNETVKILFYLPRKLFFDQKNMTLETVKRMNKQESEYCDKHCEWTMDANTISKADAVVFVFFTMGFTKKDLPKEVRNRNQIWAVYERKASPMSTCHMKNLSGVFNWTINYRKDSDIVAPYGRKIPKKANESKEVEIKFGNLTLDEWITGKEAVAIIVVSNCKTESKREVLVEELKKAGLPVQIYGECGKEICGRHALNCEDFWEDDVSKIYKFYLAFENSICTDYITEKFWPQ